MSFYQEKNKKSQFKRSKTFCCVFTRNTQAYLSVLKPRHLKRSLEVFKKQNQTKPKNTTHTKPHNSSSNFWSIVQIKKKKKKKGFMHSKS